MFSRIFMIAICWLSCFGTVFGAGHQLKAEDMPSASYLQPDAPTFDMTVARFREKYNRDNPNLFIGEFRTIPSVPADPAFLTRAASKLNSYLYASVVLEKGTGKIKSLQITYVPQSGREEKGSRETAIQYMAAVMCQFEPTLTVDESIHKVQRLLMQGKGHYFDQHQVGTLRYVTVDGGEKGMTFAIEPVKLSLYTHSI